MRYFLFLLLIIFSTSANAQEDLLSQLQEEEADEKIRNTFKSTKIINAQTNETVSKQVLDFRITHRFGNMGRQVGGGPHNLWGFDVASNIRFSFDYGITDKLQVGIGRSKFREQIDGSIKYKLLEQSTQSIPVSITLFSITAITPERDIAGRYENLAHRLSYAHQVIISKKFSDRFSMAVLPTLVHRNMIDADINPANQARETNDIFSIGFAGRIKLTQRTILVADYFYNFSDYRRNNPVRPHYNPLSIGLEIETGGHVFHINLSNSAGIIENDFIPNTRDSWQEGGYKLGFHISRVFNF
jgi:hypothetical protein